MKMEFLRGLGLDDEVIRQIQEESGKDVTAARSSRQTEIESMTARLSELENQITQRDSDLSTLQTQLKDAGSNTAKVTNLQNDLASLQSKYEADRAAWSEKMASQAYEFSAKEALGNVKFSSNAAKETFYTNLVSKKLPVENGKLLGFDDYLASVVEQDPGAFIREETTPPPAKFVAPTNPPKPDDEPTFGFNFLGVRKPKE